MLWFDIKIRHSFAFISGTQNETDMNGPSGTGAAVRVVTDRQTSARYPLYLLFCKIKCLIITSKQVVY